MKLVRNVSITMVTSFLSTGAAAVAAMLVANTMGAKGAGIFALARVVPSVVAALLGAGVTMSNAYLVGSKKYSVQAITEASMALGLILSVIGWGGWIAAGHLIQWKFFASLSYTAVLLVGVSIPFQIVRNYLNSIQQGLQTFTEANLVLLVEDVGTLIFVLPLLFWSSESAPAVIVFASVGGSAVSCIASAICLMRKGYWPTVRLHREISWEMITFGLKGHVGRIANMLNWRLDVMILSVLAPVEVVGCYAVATKVAEAFRPLSAAFTFVLRPMIAALSVSEARAQGVTLYRRVFALNLALVAIMAFAGGPIIIHMFGAEFAAAVPAFQILLFGLAALGGAGVLNGYNVGIGKPEFNSYTALAGLVITVIGDVGLIPTYSLMGAAFTSAVAYSVKAAALTWLFTSTSGVSFPQLVGLKEYSPDPA
jgi:O-antigen/teichoic acid export membrane protein